MVFPLILNSLAATGFLAGVESCRGRKNGQFTENTAATGSNGPLQSCRGKIGQGTKLARALKALGRPQNAPYAEQVPSVANVFLSPSEQKDRRHRAFLGFLGQVAYICVTFDIILLAMKKLIRIILVLAVVVLAVKFCSDRLGSVISFPGSSTGGNDDENGGWFRPKEKTEEKSEEKSLDKPYSSEEIKELERELGIGTGKPASSSTNKTTTTPTASSSSSTPLSFKGIPMTGTLSSFGTELVKAGFKRNGDGTYTGDFSGYSGCKITPSGSNPVQEVRVDFPVLSDWDELEKAYDSLKEALSQKYGIEPKTSTDNNLAVYNLPNGTITLDADVSTRSAWHVILTYANASSKSLNTPSGRNPFDDL